MNPLRNQIITHRGLEPSNPNFFSESSFEAFENHLSRGFGIEFDVNFTKDGIIIWHDANLKRLTSGKDSREFRNLTTPDVLSIKILKGRLCTLDEVLELIRNSSSTVNALHLKGRYQELHYIDRIIEVIEKHPSLYEQMFIFDVKPEAAKYIRAKNPRLLLSPSVVHAFDIKRFDTFVNNTSVTIDEAVQYKKEGLYDWAWLDEWDLTDENGKRKKLYTRENFDKIRDAGYKISLVTPELHGTSPGLYGGESHPDARDKKLLFKRIKEIIDLKPDAICTDHPEAVLKLRI